MQNENEVKARLSAIRRFGMPLTPRAPVAVGAGAADGGKQTPPMDAGSLASMASGGYTTGQPSVGDFLSMGTCTLALARARGVLIPWALTTQVDFTSGNTSAGAIQTNVNPSNEQRLGLDAYVSSATYKILNTQTANIPGSQPINDFFFNYQSGINYQLRINGQPGGNPTPYYTPISSLPASYNGGWILHYSEWPQIDMQLSINLPYTVTVFVTFNLWAPRCGRAKGDVPEEYRMNYLAAKALQSEFDIDLGC
jgi:hypothetical protein